MSAELETRRFRSWDQEATGAKDPARVIWRYQFVRLWGSWPGVVATILVAIFAIYIVGAMSYGLSYDDPGTGMSFTTWYEIPLAFLLPAILLCVLFGAPQFAEDLRFNAPLFYFSRPLRVKSYFAGKAAFLGTLLTASTLVPTVLIMVMGLVMGVPNAQEPDVSYLSPGQRASELADFHTRTIDTFGDWLAATLITLPPLILFTAFLAAVTLVASAYTRRGWHAGMAFAAIVFGLGLIHSAVADEDLPVLDLLGPAGWMNLMIVVPLSMVFHTGLNGPTREYTGMEPAVEQAVWLIPMAYIVVIGLTFLAARLAYKRLQSQEAVL